MRADEETLRVWVYKGGRRAEVFLYVSSPDALGELPPELRDALGELTLVLEVDLYDGRPMAREDAATVMRNVRERGFHLQLPPVDTPASTRVQ